MAKSLQLAGFGVDLLLQIVEEDLVAAHGIGGIGQHAHLQIHALFVGFPSLCLSWLRLRSSSFNWMAVGEAGVMLASSISMRSI